MYQQVKEQLCALIAAKRLQKDDKLPGMQELARLFATSQITVDTALKQLIADGVCYRRPKQGTFVGRRQSGMPETAGKRQRIVAVFSESANYELDIVMRPFFAGLRAGIQYVAKADMLLAAGKNAAERLDQLCSNDGIELTGVVIANCCGLSSWLPLVRKHPEVRFVLLNYQFPDFAVATPDNIFGVFNDEFCGGYMATSYLIERGFRKIAVLHYHVDDMNYQLRLEGFRRAHEDAGLLPMPNLILDLSTSGAPLERGTAGMAELLKGEWPDAVFCLNDLLAAGAKAHLRSLSQTPAIEIMGYDNLLPDISYEKAFHTVTINTNRMGHCAIQALINPHNYPGKQIFIAPRLLPRPPQTRIDKDHRVSKPNHV